MKGKKPELSNVVPMKGDVQKHVPEAPDYMSSRGREIWEELAPELVRKDRLEPAYVHQFASYCESVANFIGATHSVAIEGMYYEVKTRNGKQQKKTAAFNVQQESANAMRRDAALFGLTPVDAIRLTTGGQGDLFDDLEKMLNGSA